MPIECEVEETETDTFFVLGDVPIPDGKVARGAPSCLVTFQ